MTAHFQLDFLKTYQFTKELTLAKNLTNVQNVLNHLQTWALKNLIWKPIQAENKLFTSKLFIPIEFPLNADSAVRADGELPPPVRAPVDLVADLQAEWPVFVQISLDQDEFVQKSESHSTFEWPPLSGSEALNLSKVLPTRASSLTWVSILGSWKTGLLSLMSLSFTSTHE